MSVIEGDVTLVVGEEAFETDDALFFGVFAHSSQLYKFEVVNYK